MLTDDEILRIANKAGLYPERVQKHVGKLARVAYAAGAAAEREAWSMVRDAVVAMAEEGWLYCGPEGLSEAQEKCYAVYLLLNPPPPVIDAAIRGTP